MKTDPTLIIITGPTGIGKSRIAMEAAELLGCPIVSADSRQLYRGMEIGTAAPSKEDLERIPHFMVGITQPDDTYSAVRYEAEVIPLLEKLFTRYHYVIMEGGSMLYIDAICKGIDLMPDIPSDIRDFLKERQLTEGDKALLAELQLVDNDYFQCVDRCNMKRVLHALEIYYTTGKPYSSFLTATVKERPFRIRKIIIETARDKLYASINKRTLSMIEKGWVEEVKKLLPYRYTNALDTIGYKELFLYLDGEIDLEEAIRQIQRKTCLYARKQITWHKRDKECLHYPAEGNGEELLKLLWLKKEW